MAIANAATLTSGSSSSAIKNRYYDELFLRIAEARLVHKQLGQLNRKIAQGEGGYGTGVVYWTKWSNLDLITAGTGEGVPTTCVSMTAANVTGSTAQYDNAVSISDLMAYVSFGDVMKAAIERLAYNAGLSIDTIITKAVVPSATISVADGGATYTAITSTGTVNIAGIRKAVRLLSRNNTKQINGSWVSVIHPDVTYDIMADSSTGGWIDANKYTTSDKLFNGEVGKLLGVRFLETTNTYSPGSSITGSATVYASEFYGTDCFGVTDLQSLKTYVKGFGSGGVADPTEKISTAGWKCTFGAAMLNSAFGNTLYSVVTSTAS